MVIYVLIFSHALFICSADRLSGSHVHQRTDHGSYIASPAGDNKYPRDQDLSLNNHSQPEDDGGFSPQSQSIQQQDAGYYNQGQQPQYQDRNSYQSDPHNSIHGSQQNSYPSPQQQQYPTQDPRSSYNRDVYKDRPLPQPSPRESYQGQRSPRDGSLPPDHHAQRGAPPDQSPRDNYAGREQYPPGQDRMAGQYNGNQSHLTGDTPDGRNQRQQGMNDQDPRDVYPCQNSLHEDNGGFGDYNAGRGSISRQPEQQVAESQKRVSTASSMPRNKQDPRYSPTDPRFPYKDSQPNQYGLQGSAKYPSPESSNQEAERYQHETQKSYPGRENQPISRPYNSRDEVQSGHPSSTSPEYYGQPMREPNKQGSSSAEMLRHPRNPARPDSYTDNTRPNERESSLQRDDSLRRLQEWQKDQADRAVRGSYIQPPSPEQSLPVSDGPRVYTSDHQTRPDLNTSGQSSQYRSSGPQYRQEDNRKMYQNKEVTTTTTVTTEKQRDSLSRKQPDDEWGKYNPNHNNNLLMRGDQKQDHTQPLHVHVYENLQQQQSQQPYKPASDPSRSTALDESPGRPPLPSEYRQEYIENIADVRTPHTKNDILEAGRRSAERKDEPLVFQYPGQQVIS